MSKSDAKVLRRSAAQLALISSAATLGYDYSGGFEGAVTEAHKLVPRGFLALSDDQRKSYVPLIRDYGLQFRAGHLLRYLEARGYEKRLGNQDRPQRIASMLEIIDKAGPETEKSNRRTDLEHKGVKAADNAWTRVKDAAGLKDAPKARKPRPSKVNASDAKAPPVDMVKASPSLPANDDAVKYFDSASAALLATVNKNAKHVPIAFSSAVQDFRKAIRAAIAARKTELAAKAAKAAATA